MAAKKANKGRFDKDSFVALILDTMKYGIIDQILGPENPMTSREAGALTVEEARDQGIEVPDYQSIRFPLTYNGLNFDKIGRIIQDNGTTEVMGREEKPNKKKLKFASVYADSFVFNYQICLRPGKQFNDADRPIYSCVFQIPVNDIPLDLTDTEFDVWCKQAVAKDFAERVYPVGSEVCFEQLCQVRDDQRKKRRGKKNKPPVENTPGSRKFNIV